MLNIGPQGLPRAAASARGGGAPADHLADLGDFGPNPGALGARVYVPDGLSRGAALVVVLHGCTQSAAGYDHGAGWSTLADAHGFALLFPEQRRANNAQNCFNWFLPGDTRRGEGEAASIAGMVRAMEVKHRLDPARVYVTGLSAGGAMAGVMLATYPEVFAGGAIIAGLAYGVAGDVQQALGAMRVGTGEGADGLAARVRSASAHTGPWPRVSVWHGDADHTVAAGNADAIVRQWAGLHGLAANPTSAAQGTGYAHRTWADADGRAAVEEWRIAAMGHGTPLGGGLGVAGPYMLDVGLSSTRHIAAFFGLANVEAEAAPRRRPAPTPHPKPTRTRRLTPDPLDARRAAAASGTSGVARTIEDALRKAGLMR